MMASQHSFDKDLFISYALPDNTPLPDQNEGWIDLFHKLLEYFLMQSLGDHPTIYRRTNKTTYVDTKVADIIEKAAVLVTIISPWYVNTEDCLSELQEFLHAAEHSSGDEDSHQRRIFKVLKTLVPWEDQPEALREIKEFPFYELSPEGNIPLELRPEFGSEADREFKIRILDLAQRIKRLLESLTKESNNFNIHAATIPEKTIYIAESTADVTIYREEMIRELESRGFLVFPDSPLPKDKNNITRVVSDYLTKCRFSMHIIGGAHAFLPEGETDRRKTIAWIQNDLAAKMSADSGLRRLIWKPADIPIADPLQREYIEFFRNNSDFIRGADFLETPMQIFKEEALISLENLMRPAPASPQPDLRANHGKQVYIICTKDDLKIINSIDDVLFQHGFEVMVPEFAENGSQISEDHNDKLNLAEAVIILYASGNDRWVLSKITDLKKSRPNRSQAFEAKLVIVSGDETPNKNRFRTQFADVIRWEPNQDAGKLLAPFITRLTANN